MISNAKHIAPDEFYRYSHLTSLMMKRCRDNGIFGELYRYCPDDVNKDNGVYLLIASYNGTIAEYEENHQLFEERLEFQRDKALGVLSTTSGQFLAIDVSNLDCKEEAFNIFQNCIRLIDEMATIKAMTSQLGFATPDLIDRDVIRDTQKVYLDSVDYDKPKAFRERNNQLFVTLVCKINEAYNSGNRWNDYVKQSQKKPLSYFSDNMINTRWTTVSAAFYDYMQEAVKKYPKFVYYKEAKPLALFKDPAKVTNLLASATSYLSKKNHMAIVKIAYPEEYEDILQKIVLEYNARAFDGKVESLDEIEDPIKFVINLDDMINWNSLCKANGVPYYISKGDLDFGNQYSSREISVAVPKAMESIVSDIHNRLSAETVMVTLCNKEQKELNRSNTLDPVKNPAKADASILSW